jgi:hypothetical protein
MKSIARRMKSGGDVHRAEIMAHLEWAAADEGRYSLVQCDQRSSRRHRGGMCYAGTTVDQPRLILKEPRAEGSRWQFASARSLF